MIKLIKSMTFLFLMLWGVSVSGMTRGWFWPSARFMRACIEAGPIVEMVEEVAEDEPALREKFEELRVAYGEFKGLKERYERGNNSGWGYGSRDIDGIRYNFDDDGLARLQRELARVKLELGIIER